MEWLQAGVVAVVVLALFWGPGGAVGLALQIRGLALLATAPLLTLGLFGVTAIVVNFCGMSWSLWPALSAVVAAAAAATLLARGRGISSDLRRSPAHPCAGTTTPWLLGSIALGVLAQLVPVAVGLGRPFRLLTAHDAIAHFSMVAYARETGQASSLTISGVNTLDGTTQGFYGAAWHAVVALAGTWPDASTVFNVGFFLPAALIWTLGLTYLTQVTFPARPRVWCWAAAASAAGIALPHYLALRPEGMVANAIGVALVPAFVGLVTSRPALPPALRIMAVGMSAAGVGLSHPNALLSCVVVLAPWALPRAVHRLRTATWSTRRVMVLLLGLVGSGTGLVLLARSDKMQGVVGVTPESPLAWWEAIIHVLSGDLTGMGWGSGFVIVGAATVGAIVTWRIPAARWLTAANIVMVGMYLLATSSIPVLTDIDRPWYGEPRRIASVVAAVMVPLAALAIDSVPAWLVASGRLRTSVPRRRVGLIVGLLALGVATVPAAIAAAALVRDSYGGSTDLSRPSVASDAEIAMMRRLSTEIDPNRAILGSAFSGAAHLYGLNGQKVMPPTYLTQANDDLQYVRGHIDDLGGDALLCRALARLDVRYLYVDPKPWDAVTDRISLLSPPRLGVRLVDSGGSASVYEVTAC